MVQILRNWWPVFAALLLVQMGNGLSSSLISIAGEARSFAPFLQGLVLSSFFAGSVAGAAAAPFVIRRTSHAFAAVAFTIALAATTLGFALFDDPWMWVVTRLLAGAAITGMFTTVESWLSLSIADSIRGRVFSMYILIQLSGLASGQLLISARGIGEEVLFVFSAIVIGLSAIAYRTERIEHPVVEAPRHISFAQMVARAPMGSLCIALSGFSWAGLMASGPATLQMMGLSDIDKSLFMALAVLSGMASQLPAGWLADHLDRRLVLLVLSTGAALAALVPLAGEGSTILFAFAILYGAATFPLYAVGVARVSEVLHQNERTAASAWMIIVFDIGAVIAPLALATSSASLGASGYFLLLALPQAIYALATLASLSRRRAR
jgi:MFS family permease